MMMGEYLCLLAYGYNTWRSGGVPIESPDTRKAKQEGKKEINRLLFAVPATFDVLGSTCNFFGLSRVAASVYQMMRAFMIVVTATFSVLFLKKKYYVHHMIGISMVIAGVIIVGTVSIHNAPANAKTTDPVGILFLVCAQFFSGGMMVTEEKLIKGSGHVTPLLAIGLEGLSGCTLLILLLPFIGLIPCTREMANGKDIACPFGHLDDSTAAIAQIFGETELCLLVFGSMCSIAMFNFFGISITQLLSSSSRAVIDPTRTLFIWIMSILLGWEAFIYLQLIGFAISTFGMLVFNEIVPLPFWGIDYNHTKRINERDKQRQELIKSNLIVAIEAKK
jgi:multidrug transporter EmrE-like cation transporter